jgi:hypothetical protein
MSWLAAQRMDVYKKMMIGVMAGGVFERENQLTYHST